jgi:hypothetical protein
MGSLSTMVDDAITGYYHAPGDALAILQRVAAGPLLLHAHRSWASTGWIIDNGIQKIGPSKLHFMERTSERTSSSYPYTWHAKGM